MRFLHFFFFLLIFACPTLNWGQGLNSITFEVESYSMPFAGGLNNPQFSSIDFDRDGYLDLFVFDRACNCIALFQNLAQKDSASYIIRANWSESFPNLKNWAILKDFNSDNLPDIFSYSDIPGIDGVIVYRGILKNNSLSFEKVDINAPFNLIHYMQPSGALTPLYVSKIDYPAIEDVDCDGDVDLVTFNSGGGVIEFYKNLSIEKGFNLDTLIFERADRCWGGLYESGISEQINLSPNLGECFENVAPTEEILPRHAGSTLLILDTNGDEIKDLFLGDISFSNLSLLTNAGDCETSWFNHQEVHYPESDLPVQINIFPVAFSMDLNNDRFLDLIVTSNDRLNGDDQQNIWWYKGTESSFLSNPKLQDKSFLIKEMIDLGRSSSIVLEDVTGDGLKDMIMSGDQKLNDLLNSKLFLFQNIGTSSDPRFKLIDSDYLGLSDFNFTSSFVPAIGDIDGDGVSDFIVGEQSGSLFFGKGTLNDNGVLTVTNWQFPFEDIDVGNYSHPFIFDFNKDGFGDLFIGEQTGNINYLQNSGETDNWFTNSLKELPNSEFFGNIDARFPGYFFGFSSPFIFENEEGVHLLTGSEAGFFKHYISFDRSNNFVELTDQITSLNAGARTTPFLTDIDEDGYLEMFTGNYRGGALIYSTPLLIQNKVAVKSEHNGDISIFPNPTKGVISLKADNLFNEEIELIVYDIKGRIILYQKHFNPKISSFTIEKNGVYVVQVIESQQVIFNQKVIVY